MPRRKKGHTRILDSNNQAHPNGSEKSTSESDKSPEDTSSLANSEDTGCDQNLGNQKRKKTHRGGRKHNKYDNSASKSDDEHTSEMINESPNGNGNAPHDGDGTISKQTRHETVFDKTIENNQTPLFNQNSRQYNKHVARKQTDAPTNLNEDKSQKDKIIYKDDQRIRNIKCNSSPNGTQNQLNPNDIPACSDSLDDDQDSSDDMEDYVEYKIKPRSIFLSNACNFCKTVESTSIRLKVCFQCQMVSYCCDEHQRKDNQHQQFCSAICCVRDRRGTEYIYQNAKDLSMEDFRRLRIHVLTLCQHASKRPLEPYEKEILLYPRLCYSSKCRQWRPDKLMNCPNCKQVSYCVNHPEHLSIDHIMWCDSFKLFHHLVARTHKQGRIEPELPSKISSERYLLPEKISEFFKYVITDNNVLNDECDVAVLSLLATAPLSTLYALQKIDSDRIWDALRIHVVGAELQFEADTLNKWECFFAHLVPELKTLTVVFVGPELNVEKLPVDILSKIRMCKHCKANGHIIKFEFKCRTMYHDYADSAEFSTPDLICAFNPGLHRRTGYAGRDTWPETIRAISRAGVPFVSTAYTEHEAPLDLERIKESAGRNVEVLIPPQVNPYASLKPDRNFISEENAPLIFKNFYITVVK